MGSRLRNGEPAPAILRVGRVAVAERRLGRHHELHDVRGQRRKAQASPAQIRRAFFLAGALPATEVLTFQLHILRVIENTN